MDASGPTAFQDVPLIGETAGSLQSLSDAIALGSFFLQWKFSSVACVLSLMGFAFVVGCFLTSKTRRKVLLISQQLKDISQALESLAMAHNMMPPMEPAQPVDFSPLDSPLQCIDAKLLQLDKETKDLKALMSNLEVDQAFAKIEKLAQLANNNIKVSEHNSEQLQQWHQNVPPKIKEIHHFVSALPAVTKTLQATGLDMQKSFAMAETTSDGLMNQSRECLQLLQSDNKAMTERLIKVESALDEVKGSLKQLSLDVHVSRTKCEQKLDSIPKGPQRSHGVVELDFQRPERHDPAN